ncbi:MAG: ABC transporter ATP-binding protein [Gammaproteobacteria bacterium]
MAADTPKKSQIPPLWLLSPLLAPYFWQIAGFVVLGVIASLLEGLSIGLMVPLLQGTNAAPGADGPWLSRIEILAETIPAESRTETLAVLILAAILLKIIIAYIFTGLAAWVRSRVLHDIRTQMYRQIVAVSQEYLDTQPAGALLHTLTGGALDVAFTVISLLWLLLNISTILIYSLLLMAVAWKLTLAVVSTLLILSKLVHRVIGDVKSVGRSNQSLDNALSQSIKETLLGIPTIRAFGREAFESERFAATSLASHRMEMKRERLVALVHPLSEGLAAMTLMGLTFLALKSGLSLPVLATVVFMLLRLQPQLQSANTQLAVIRSRYAAVESVLNLLEPAGKPYPRAGEKHFQRLQQGISFANVCFAYQGKDRKALSHIDFEIQRGQTIAIVGPSGAGKSTLIHLLCRFYEPTCGHIRADGTDVDEFDLESWRERIALVSQDVHVFNATVRDNIAYGKLGAGETEIISAAKRAHAHEFILQLPKAYDTLVGERGLMLSGGQRQRLSIARAVLRDPEILILDEATNALDSLSEAQIQASLEALKQNRTVLVVAHRLSTIQRADRIVVLDQGRIVEQGRFQELLEHGGLFAALYRSHRLDIVE